MSRPVAPGEPGRDLEVVVVDDDRDWVLLMELALMFEGFRVTRAYSGEEALAIIETAEPDAIVLDIVLPGVDGWEVLRRLAGSDRTAGIPVVVVSGRGGGDASARVAELGGRAYLSKPCQTSALAGTVRSVCRNHPKTQGRGTG